MSAQTAAKGWSSATFEAGVERAYLREVENGQRNVSLEVVEKLARALDVSPETLMLPQIRQTC